MLTYNQLKSFVILIKTGSFSQTAKFLMTTQPTISKHISQIEDNLDKTLLVKNSNGRKVLLTNDGRRFLLHAEDIIKSYEKLSNLFVEDKECQKLSIGSVKAYFHISLIDKTKEMAKEFPCLDINMEICGSDMLLHNLISKTMDIVFVIGDCSDVFIETKYITYLDLSWYVSEELYEHISKINNIPDIFSKYQIMQSKENNFPSRIIKKALKNNKISKFNIHESDSMQTMFDLVNSGAGIGFMPKKYIELYNEQRSDNNLVEIPMLSTEGINIYSAILRNSDKKQYYKFLVDSLGAVTC